MLLSVALILVVGMFMGWLCRKIKLPSLLGMLLTGILLGPYVSNLIDASVLGISAELRKVALIIILTRAGMLLIAPKLLGLSLLEAAILGSVLAAVSPAVVVIFDALLFRMAGVFVCLFHTGFEKKEKLFTMLAYTPKATVQAASMTDASFVNSADAP